MVVAIAARPIIDARISMPSLARDVIMRPGVLGRLEASQRVTLVSAPAGYGKTTAVVSWLQAVSHTREADQPEVAVAWYSIEEGDDNLFTFVTYLIAAIERVLPGACQRVAASLRDVDLPSPTYLATLLLADLAWLPQRLILALDDYHHIHDAGVRQLMSALLRHAPSLFHLVLIARFTPALPLARLRAAGEVAEIEMAHLALTRQEVCQLLEMLWGRAVDAETVQSLYAQTEGWAAGLRLLTLGAQQTNADARSLLEVEGRRQHLLFDFLVEEVLTQLPAQTLAFLLDTALLETLTPALCDAVRGCNAATCDSATMLRQLVQENLFITAIAGQDGWYRYHPQFQACLRRRLHQERTVGEIQQLHMRAAVWYGEYGYVTESMQAYLAAGFPERAADQLELALGSLYRQEQNQLLQHLMGLLPPALAAERPSLLMLQCWLAELRSQWTVMRQRAEQAERLLQRSGKCAGLTPVQTVRGEIHAARSYYLVANATLAEQQAAAEQALATLPAEHVQGRGFALINLARIYRWQGRLQETELLLENALAERGLHPDALTLRLLNALTLHHVYTMRLDQAERTGQLYLTLADESGLKLSQGFAHSILGCIACMRNNLEQAESHLAACVADPRTIRAAVLLTQIYLYLLLVGGRAPERIATTDAVLDRLHTLARQDGSREMLRTVEALRVLAALLRGDKSTALAWVHDRPMPPIVVGKPLESLIWARCKLADGTPASLEQAHAGLERLAAASIQRHDAAFHLEATVLQALVADAQGKEAESLALLGPAVSLAAAQRAPLVFMGAGPAMTRLLHRLAAEPTLDAAVRALLDMLDDGDDRRLPADVLDQTVAGALSIPCYEPLTRRELQIVELLAQRLSNEEIAASLVISPHTVRNHLANLYAKLGVTSRRAAVAEAQRLGLIPSHAPRNTHHPIVQN
ncbi:MAG: LuxR C-terminal-related transcriptional regulator [Caldilinea sp.]